jgi:hypothetical protein
VVRRLWRCYNFRMKTPPVYIAHAATDGDVRRAYGLKKADVTRILRRFNKTSRSSVMVKAKAKKKKAAVVAP